MSIESQKSEAHKLFDKIIKSVNVLCNQGRREKFRTSFDHDRDTFAQRVIDLSGNPKELATYLDSTLYDQKIVLDSLKKIIAIEKEYDAVWNDVINKLNVFATDKMLSNLSPNDATLKAQADQSHAECIAALAKFKSFVPKIP
ncbi:MAG: hypothetical protein JSS93_03985 [Bacteroidetes bacterium]|nr:hypothetical protein [Bacteroidota bacterium]